jgi:hypothetical protein
VAFESPSSTFHQAMDREHRRTSTNFKVCNQIHHPLLKQRVAADALSTWSFTYSSSSSVTTLPQIPPLHHHRSLTYPALHKRHTTKTITTATTTITTTHHSGGEWSLPGTNNQHNDTTQETASISGCRSCQRRRRTTWVGRTTSRIQ